MKTKTHYLLYDFDSLSEQQLMEMEQIKQHTYLVRGQQLEQFLAAYPFEASSLKGFVVNPAATYLATHNVDANCPNEIVTASYSLGILSIQHASSSYLSKVKYGEELVCTAQFISALQLIELQPAVEVKSLLYISYPYEYAWPLNYVEVVQYDEIKN